MTYLATALSFAIAVFVIWLLCLREVREVDEHATEWERRHG